VAVVCVTVTGSEEAQGLVTKLEQMLRLSEILCDPHDHDGPSIVTGLEEADPEDTYSADDYIPGTHGTTGRPAGGIRDFPEYMLKWWKRSAAPSPSE
jgi:hypothetical protein